MTERIDSRKQSASPAKPASAFCIGQCVRVATRGRARIAMQILPGLWGVSFLDLDGYGYVFEAEMSA